MDLVTIGITVLAMSVVVMVYLECSGLMMKKLEISQISRNYILKMETEGYLSQENKNSLLQELQNIGVLEPELTGTTLQPVAYGDTILLKIKGKVVTRTIKEEDLWNGGFESRQVTMEEIRMSTAKN